MSGTHLKLLCTNTCPAEVKISFVQNGVIETMVMVCFSLLLLPKCLPNVCNPQVREASLMKMKLQRTESNFSVAIHILNADDQDRKTVMPRLNAQDLSDSSPVGMFRRFISRLKLMFDGFKVWDWKLHPFQCVKRPEEKSFRVFFCEAAAKGKGNRIFNLGFPSPIVFDQDLMDGTMPLHPFYGLQWHFSLTFNFWHCWQKWRVKDSAKGENLTTLWN